MIIQNLYGYIGLIIRYNSKIRLKKVFTVIVLEIKSNHDLNNNVNKIFKSFLYVLWHP